MDPAGMSGMADMLASMPPEQMEQMARMSGAPPVRILVLLLLLLGHAEQPRTFAKHWPAIQQSATCTASSPPCRLFSCCYVSADLVQARLIGS